MYKWIPEQRSEQQLFFWIATVLRTSRQAPLLEQKTKLLRSVGVIKPALMLLKRDVLVAIRRPFDMLLPLFFFILSATLFPLGFIQNSEKLSFFAPAIIWISALFSVLMSLDFLFRDDHEDGWLDQMLLSDVPLAILVAIRVFATWIVTILPLITILPVIGLMFHLSGYVVFILMASLLLGTPILYFIGAIASSITVRIRTGAVLLPLLVLPLNIPVLVFGAGAANAALVGASVSGQLMMLGAFLLLAFSLAPLAVSGILRVQLD